MRKSKKETSLPEGGYTTTGMAWNFAGVEDHHDRDGNSKGVKCLTCNKSVI